MNLLNRYEKICHNITRIRNYSIYCTKGGGSIILNRYKGDIHNALAGAFSNIGN